MLVTGQMRVDSRQPKALRGDSVEATASASSATPPGTRRASRPGGVADDADPVASTESPRSPFGCRESNLICLVINICNFNRQPLQDNGFGSTSFTGTSFTIRLGAGFEHRRRR